jgi:hypothetical protein
MSRAYKLFRTVFSWTVLAVFAALIGEFAIEVAREHGVYEHPTARLKAVMDLLASVRGSPWLLGSLAFAVGMVVGMWLDTLALRHMRVPRHPGQGPLSIAFDPHDARFVRRDSNAVRFYVGVHNNGDETLESVSLWGQDSEFVRRTIGAAQFKRTHRMFDRMPPILRLDALDPGATELVELFGIPNDFSFVESNSFLRTPHTFYLEVRARDVQTVIAEFSYDHTANSVIQKVGQIPA